MQNIKARFLTNTTFFFLVYGIMLYVVLRALSIVITHDEAYSFYNAKHFWWVETLCTGNTHWFNFLAMKTCVLFGLEKASQLRWFSLLSSGIFLTVVYFWIRSIKDLPLKVFTFAIGVLNPFLVDYLSLARGYSTALMFESLSILCYFIAHKHKKQKAATLALFFSGMAAIANFNFFYFFSAFSVVYFYGHYFKKGFDFLRNKTFYLESLFALVIMALVVKALQFITNCSNDIGAYGAEDLVSGIFMGYVHTFLYHIDISENILLILAYCLCALVLTAAVFGLRKPVKQPILWYRIASSVLLIMIAFCVFNKWFFGVLYPTYRTALMFYPLIALVLVGFVNSLLPKQKMKAIVLYSLSIVIALHFIMCMSLRKSFDYWQQSDTKTCYTYLDSLDAKNVGIAPELFGVYRNYYQLTDYYSFEFEGKSINTMLPNGLDTQQELKNYDYLVLFPPYNLSFYKNNAVEFEGVRFYKNTGTLVVRVLPPAL